MELLSEEQREKLHYTFSVDFFHDPFFQDFVSNKDLLVKFVEHRGHDHVLAAPLIDVFSICIFNHAVDDRKAYEVYGTIQIIDGQGALFMLYDRKGDMAETVCNGDTLTLVMSIDRAIAITPSNVVALKIDLKGRYGNMDEQIVNDFRTWDYNMFDDFDKKKIDVINGAHGWVAVEYVAYRHAVFTYVEVLLLKGRDDEPCKNARVYGSIVAHCGNKYSTVLFDKTQNESIVVEYGTYLELSRYLVVVPAWSSFTINANLWNANTYLKIVDENDPIDEIIVLHQYSHEIEIKGQNGLIQVEFEWSHAEQPPPLQRNVEKASDEENMLPITKKYEVTHDQQTLSPLSNSNLFSDMRESLEWLTKEVMEVFSISIFSDSDEELNLWGSIEAYNRFFIRNSFFTFFEKTSPKRLLSNQTLPMAFPTRCFASPSPVFTVTLNLLDVDGRVISKGSICWEERMFETSVSWLNRLLCSVVRGDDGYYAAVHYTIFSAAIQAAVKICLIDKNSSLKDAKVSGCVRTQYSDFTYQTQYDMEVYRRKLFVGHIEDPSWKYQDSKIQLLESMVAVEESFTLIVDLNLTLISQHRDSPDKVKVDDLLQAVETFEHQLEFRPNMGYKEMILEKTSHQIVVSVEWSEVL